MQPTGVDSCSDCLQLLVDAGDELVCPSCGVVKGKEVVERGFSPLIRASVFGRQPLGSYMGTKWVMNKERFSSGISGSNSGYDYMKVVSDFAGKYGGTAFECARVIERVGERLVLPRFVILQAASIARKVLSVARPHRRVTIAELSAYSLIAACKIEGVTSVSIREIIAAHAILGKGVTSSSIIQLTLNSPIRVFARKPEEYIPRVLARLSKNPKFSERLSKEGVSRGVFFNSLGQVARELLGTIDRNTMAGKRPCALAASAVYSAETVLSTCESRKRRITQRELAGCCDTAEYTIREQCATLFLPAVGRLVNPAGRSPFLRNGR